MKTHRAYLLLFKYRLSFVSKYAKTKISSHKTEINGRHFPDDIFQCILLNENALISIKNSLKFFPKGPINHISTLVQIMAWRQDIIEANDG